MDADDDVARVRRLATWSLSCGAIGFVAALLGPAVVGLALALPALTSGVWARREGAALGAPPRLAWADYGIAGAIAAVVVAIGRVVLEMQ